MQSVRRTARHLVPKVMLRMAVLCLGLVFLGWAPNATAKPEGGKKPTGRVSEVTLSGVTFVKSRGGVSNVLLRAAEAAIDIVGDKVFLRDMDVETKTDAGVKEFWMRCDQGVIDLSTGDFLANGHVEGQTADGRNFKTDSAKYNDEQGLISTDVPVLLTEVTGTLRGGGFQYWVHEGRLQLTGGATLLQEDGAAGGSGSQGGSGE
jgi:LPS export ABC transporter protein LptC